MQTPWDHRYAQRTQRMRGSAIRELLKLTENPELFRWAGATGTGCVSGGRIHPSLYPGDERPWRRGITIMAPQMDMCH